jgi:ATP-dependent 26S proteasome regulatory subunit
MPPVRRIIMETKELDILIRSGHPYIWVQTYEETQAMEAIKDIAKRLTVQEKGFSVQTWTCTKGLITNGDSDDETMPPTAALMKVVNLETQTICVFKDLHRYLDPNCGDYNTVVRSMRDIADHLKGKRKTVIILSPVLSIPVELEKLITVVNIPLPDEKDLAVVFNEVVDPFLSNIDDESKAVREIVKEQAKDRDRIVQAGLGMTGIEFENAVSRGIAEHSLTVDIVINAKRDIIKKMGFLEFIEHKETADSIGGLWVLKDNMRRYAKLDTPEGRAFGAYPPKGIILMGPSGTGKSLSAKVIAQVLKRPLLRLDISKITTSLYGESVGHLMRALMIAEAMGRVVLWIDEIEKVFGSSQGGVHEESMKMISVLLTHTEECQKPIFRIATCNNVLLLLPELQQRFKMFAVMLPDEEEREEILKIHLTKAKQDLSRFDIETLAANCEGYAGREIAIAITEGMGVAFDRDTLLSDLIIMEELTKIAPTRKTRAEDVKAIEKFIEEKGIQVANKRPQRGGMPTADTARGAGIVT